MPADTQLIFIDGLPGSGKSTTGLWLARVLEQAGLQARLLTEFEPDHPLNVGGPLHPAGGTTGEALFQRYLPESYRAESLDRWRAFVSDAQVSEAVWVLESYPYQNSARILIQMDAAPELITEYTRTVEEVASPLRPALIYLARPDAERALREAAAMRGPEWTEYAVAVATRCPYGEARGLTGLEGAIEIVRWYREQMEALVAESRLPKLILSECAGRWDACYAEITRFLGLSAR